ncbi:AraC family transcriptional regulator, partial [Erysipelatoclostridium ramosum]
EEHKQMDIYSDRIICSMFSILMSLLNRNYNKDITISQNNIIKNLPDFQIIDYLLKNYKHASLENISKEFHYTVPYCSKLIKETTGYSFSELLTKIRMQNGKNLLLNTRLSIEAISLNLGYKNPETFIRVFKKNYLITPHQFRKQANL